MRRWARFLVSFGVLGAVLVLLPWQQVLDVWKDVSFLVWSAVLGGFIVVHFAGAMKWRMIVNTHAGRSALSLFDAYRFYVAGLFANLCLPSIVGGDVLRAALAGRRISEPEAVVLGGLADRIIDTAALAMLVAAGGILTGSVITGWTGPFLILLGVIAAAAGLLLLPLIVRRPLHRWPRRYRHRIGRAFVSLRRLLRNPGAAGTAFAVALMMQSSFVLLNAWLGASLGINVPLAVWFLAWPLAKAAGLLPISIGGLGVRDATLAALLVPFGIPAAQGLVASLVWQTILFGGGLLGGLFWWMMSRSRGNRDETLSLIRTTRRTHG